MKFFRINSLVLAGYGFCQVVDFANDLKGKIDSVDALVRSWQLSEGASGAQVIQDKYTEISDAVYALANEIGGRTATEVDQGSIDGISTSMSNLFAGLKSQKSNFESAGIDSTVAKDITAVIFPAEVFVNTTIEITSTDCQVLDSIAPSLKKIHDDFNDICQVYSIQQGHFPTTVSCTDSSVSAPTSSEIIRTPSGSPSLSSELNPQITVTESSSEFASFASDMSSLIPSDLFSGLSVDLSMISDLYSTYDTESVSAYFSDMSIPAGVDSDMEPTLSTTSTTVSQVVPRPSSASQTSNNTPPTSITSQMSLSGTGVPIRHDSDMPQSGRVSHVVGSGTTIYTTISCSDTTAVFCPDSTACITVTVSCDPNNGGLPSGMPSNGGNGGNGGMSSGLPSDMLSGLPSDMLSGLPSDMPSGIPSDLLSDLPSDMPTAIPSDMLSGIPSDLLSGMPSGMPSGIAGGNGGAPNSAGNGNNSNMNGTFSGPMGNGNRVPSTTLSSNGGGMSPSNARPSMNSNMPIFPSMSNGNTNGTRPNNPAPLPQNKGNSKKTNWILTFTSAFTLSAAFGFFPFVA